MIAADQARQRPRDARLLVVDAHGGLRHQLRSRLVDALRPGDLVIANDAATLPASLHGRHVASGATIEVRLAGRRSLNPREVNDFSAVVFGEGDFHTRTEDRPAPPTLRPGDRLELGPLHATVQALIGHPRLIDLHFDGSPEQVWAGLARHGQPIQYAHLHSPLALWDVWSPIAATPVAFEAPSAGFALDWRTIAALRDRGVGFASLTHAAGLSSTGDATLDARLPFDEPYRIPPATVRAIEHSKGRIVAIGTTVVRALEHAAAHDGGLQHGESIATQKLGPASRLRLVDMIFSGTHERGSSHYELLRAFTDDDTLRRADAALEAQCFRTHEFGDSVLIERRGSRQSKALCRLPSHSMGFAAAIRPATSFIVPMKAK